MCSSDTTVGSSATRTEDTADRSGWIMFIVVVMKQTLCSVDITDGESTIVLTLMTSQYHVTQVGNFAVVVLVFCVQSYLL